MTDNGGDGLVAARHLAHFGYRPEIVYPKPGKSPLFERLQQQCRVLGIPIHSELPALESYALLVDGIFGFSFAGDVRAPFDGILQRLHQRSMLQPLVSIDIPSGWHVENGPTGSSNTHLTPDMVVSLTAPKLCLRHFTGPHYVGGRFVPPALAAALAFDVPIYSGVEQFAPMPLHPPSPSPAHADADDSTAANLKAAAAAAAL